MTAQATERRLDDQAQTPETVLARIEQASERIETPCGDGRMVWRVWGQGARPPLVLLHGGHGSWRHWVHTIPAFAVDRRVVAPDLPGLGESATPGLESTPPAIAAILRDGLASVLPAGARYDLAGFSFGGMIAGNLAAIDPDRLTVVAPGGLGGFRSMVTLEKVISLNGAARLAAHRVNLERLMFADATRIDALALAIQDWNTRLGRIKSRPMSRTDALLTALARVQAPLHAIYGEFDALSYPHMHEREERLRSARPDLNFHIIPGAGHWVAYEAAAAFNTLLRGLLDPASAV
jgi:pimeloyl-ACP methyl ester carboxylesterase